MMPGQSALNVGFHISFLSTFIALADDTYGRLPQLSFPQAHKD
jgi:hypothetical protein